MKDSFISNIIFSEKYQISFPDYEYLGGRKFEESQRDVVESGDCRPCTKDRTIRFLGLLDSAVNCVHPSLFYFENDDVSKLKSIFSVGQKST